MPVYKVVDAERLDAGLTAVADAIRERSGSTGTMTLDQMPQRIADIDPNGYLSFSTRARFEDLNLFGREEIDIYMPRLTNATELVLTTANNTTVKHITITGGDNAHITNISAMFNLNWRGGVLERITLNADLSGVITCGKFSFAHSGAIHTIDGIPLNLQSLTAGTLEIVFLYALEYIRFAPGTLNTSITIKHSTELSLDSIQSVIEALSDSASGTTCTLSLTAVNAAFETAEGAADGSTSEAWLALTATKSNWTISLV